MRLAAARSHQCEKTTTKDLEVADPTVDQPGKVDILLGCNVLQDVLAHKTRQGPPKQTIAVNTVFGWVILGRYVPDQDPISDTVCNLAVNPSTDSLLQKLWEMEEVSTNSHCHTQDEKVVVEHFTKSHTYLPSGRYQVTLPRKTDAPSLGDSRK